MVAKMELDGFMRVIIPKR